MPDRIAIIAGTPTPAPAGAIAWKYADPTEDARWLFDAAEVAEVMAADPNLIVAVEERITIRRGGEHGTPLACRVIHGEDGGLRVIDESSDPTADALYVARDLDDLAEQVNRDGHWLDGYLDDEAGR